MANIFQMPLVTPLVCSACGAHGEGTCACGAPYVLAKQRVAEYDKTTPGRSTRQAAADLGVSNKTVSKARARVTPVTPQVTGRDGKKYPAKRSLRLVTRTLRSGEIVQEPEDCPTEAEAEEEYQLTCYDQACRFLEEMTGETRRRFFAHIKRKYGDEIKF